MNKISFNNCLLFLGRDMRCSPTSLRGGIPDVAISQKLKVKNEKPKTRRQETGDKALYINVIARNKAIYNK